jgi:hypothetical protein
VLVALTVAYSHLSDDNMTIADWALIAFVLFISAVVGLDCLYSCVSLLHRLRAVGDGVRRGVGRVHHRLASNRHCSDILRHLGLLAARAMKMIVVLDIPDAARTHCGGFGRSLVYSLYGALSVKHKFRHTSSFHLLSREGLHLSIAVDLPCLENAAHAIARTATRTNRPTVRLG